MIVLLLADAISGTLRLQDMVNHTDTGHGHAVTTPTAGVTHAELMDGRKATVQG